MDGRARASVIPEHLIRHIFAFDPTSAMLNSTASKFIRASQHTHSRSELRRTALGSSLLHRHGDGDEVFVKEGWSLEYLLFRSRCGITDGVCGAKDTRKCALSPDDSVGNGDTTLLSHHDTHHMELHGTTGFASCSSSTRSPSSSCWRE